MYLLEENERGSGIQRRVEIFHRRIFLVSALFPRAQYWY
jgi:hypothetical protein